MAPPLVAPPDDGATRLPTGYPTAELHVISHRAWIGFALLMLVGLCTGMLIALQGS